MARDDTDCRRYLGCQGCGFVFMIGVTGLKTH